MLKLYKIIRRIAYTSALSGLTLALLNRIDLLPGPKIIQTAYTLILATFILFFISYLLILAIKLKK